MFHILEHEAIDQVQKSSGPMCKVYDEATLEVQHYSMIRNRHHQPLCMQSSRVVAHGLK